MKSFEESTKYPLGIVSKPPSHYTVATPEPEINPNIGTFTTVNVTEDAGLEQLRNFSRAGQRHHALLMKQEDGTLNVAERTGQPCWGSLREYGSKSSRPYDGWPGDLRTPQRTFPAGEPLAVSIPFSSYAGATLPGWVEENFLSSSSPWRELGKLADPEYVYDADGVLKGVMYRKTDIDPSLMVSSFRNSGNLSGWATKHTYLKQQFPDLDPRTLWILTMASTTKEAIFNGNFQFTFAAWGGAADISRIRDGEILEDLREGTFRNRFSYNRPVIDCLFGYDPERKKMYEGKTFKDVKEFEDWFLKLERWTYNA